MQTTTQRHVGLHLFLMLLLANNLTAGEEGPKLTATPTVLFSEQLKTDEAPCFPRLAAVHRGES